MNLFDKIVSDAIKNQPELAGLRVVVEKEILHHDILRVMRDHQLLKGLTFIGGTCLRMCYGGIRLSEDLDFTGGLDFSKEKLSQMGKILTENLTSKYGLQVTVGEPIKESGNVDTWKIKIITRPEAKDLPTQQINVDICALPSYDVKPVMLQNFYGIELGTSGLIIQTQSREEIYSDKVIAFALRPNRIKYRDLWDILWLHSQNIKPNLDFVFKKLNDRDVPVNKFLNLYRERLCSLQENSELYLEFKKEMQRFLPEMRIKGMLEQEGVWNILHHLLKDFYQQLLQKH